MAFFRRVVTPTQHLELVVTARLFFEATNMWED